MGQFGNISVSRYRRLLSALGLSYVRTKGGHEMWWKEGLHRNVVFQTHIDPVSERVIYTNNLTMGISTKDFANLLKTIK